ncbi:MAG TPA: PilC/PilY family type IV pilus protein [Gammaproteobacteria bacterium]|nr:PilC/PilY family type IV pilus protein [Gammaproteobacteria bacterium]
MSALSKRSIALLGGVVWALLAGTPALADDTELFVYDSSVLAVKPNVLFIFDTSGSMQTIVDSQANYNPSTTYAGTCDSTKLYWRSFTWWSTDPPSCDTTQSFDRSVFKCRAALDAFQTNAGRWSDNFAQFNVTTRTKKGNTTTTAVWSNLNGSVDPQYVECASDSGVNGNDGDSSATTRKWAQDDDASNPWSDRSRDVISWRNMSMATVYDANYLNWYYGPTGPESRSQIMKDVATSLVGSINNVNLGLMRYNSNGEGGHLVHAVEDVSTSRDSLIAAINALPADSNTPLSETLYEAARYWMSRSPDYGAGFNIGTDADGNYVSPAQHACQKNYIVYLTDGEPTDDNERDTQIKSLVDESGNSFADLVGSACDAETYPLGFNPSGGDCLDELAEFLHKGDISASLPGQQGVTTYTVGFTVDLPILKDTAERSGGKYYTAEDTATLSQALTNIVTSILKTQSTFTAPTVSVDSFNRTQHKNDLFVTVFEPSSAIHWPGNLKKYKLKPSDSTIIDQNGAEAVDTSTGFFKPLAQSFWTDAADGPNVTLGGAANKLPDPSTRHVYTYLGDADLTADSNGVTRTNTGITDTMLNIGNPGDPSHDEVIDFIRGVDVTDSNQNNSTTDGRDQMGDPLHSQPISMIYGGTVADPDPDDAVVFFATNDGYVHAIDPNTGVELWSFIPPEFLGDQVDLLQNLTATAKHYGVDGSLRLQVLADNDGVIEPDDGEKVYLFFGMRRGGSFYYALDVTNPDAPQFLWRLDGADLPGLGQTWSNPVPTKMDIDDDAENADHLVVVLGGGYDATQDNYDYSTDTSGNHIYIVDSVTGALLWHGGPSDATKNFADMNYSIPADVRVIDLDGDGFADRMYAADMGGQVWRFDISNGQAPSTLVNGGVIAQLGGAGLDSPARTDTRRFYYAPDVALVSNSGQSYLHIGIGSGYRAHPNSTDNADRFYALRDYSPFQQKTQAQFDSLTKITEDDLTDITNNVTASVGTDSAGWVLHLDPGEKVLAEARTFNNQVFFTTFTPGASPDADDCVPRLGTNRLYIVSIKNGAPVTNLDKPVNDLNGDGVVDDRDNDANGDGVVDSNDDVNGDGTVDGNDLSVADRSSEFNGSISSEVVFVFPSAENASECVGDECAPPPVGCVDLFCFPTNFANNPVRTFWTENNLQR